MTATRLAVWIGIGGALLAGCATVHPDFDKYFTSTYEGAEYGNSSPDHAEWMRLLVTRYGCDTMPLRAATRGGTEMATGVPPCDIASAIPPGEIQAFKTPTGMRELWRFGAGSNKYTVHFEGASTATLRSTFVQWY